MTEGLIILAILVALFEIVRGTIEADAPMPELREIKIDDEDEKRRRR